MRRLLAPLLALTLVLAGCGGSSGDASGAPVPNSAASCPTDNTRSFAKTRFVADVGSAAFLIRRYLYQPYTKGAFTKGADGRVTAIVKGTAAAAASVKLLKNAQQNAQANPTLCRTVAKPLAALVSTLGGLKGVTGSAFTAGALGGLGGTLTSLLSGAASSGIEVPEKETPLG